MNRNQMDDIYLSKNKAKENRKDTDTYDRSLSVQTCCPLVSFDWSLEYWILHEHERADRCATNGFFLAEINTTLEVKPA